MAIRLGLLGAPNSGKSFGRSFLNGEECFAILPSTKEPYLFKKGTFPNDPEPVSGIQFQSPKFKTTKELALAVGYNPKTSISPEIFLIKKLNAQPELTEKITFSGNFVYDGDMGNIAHVGAFVEKFMPHVKVFILPDFTHFLTNLIGTPEFQNSKGYDKFTKAAIASLNAFFTTAIDNMRQDLIVITEYHLEGRDEKGDGIFVPQGKMLKDNFKPESYFDYLLGARWIPHEEDPGLKKSERYVYLTEPTSEFRYIRDGGLFNDSQIPNNLALVVDAIRKRKRI